METEAQPFLLAKHSGPDEINEDDPDEIMMPPLGAHNDTSTTRKDQAWGVAFKLNVAVACICALCYGRTGLDVMANNNAAWVGGGQHLWSSWLLPVVAGAGIIAMAWVFAWGVLRMLIHTSTQILQVSYLACAGMLCLTALSAFTSGHWLPAAFAGVAGAFVVRAFFRHQSRFHSAGATLKVAALAIESMPSLVHAALFMSGVQVLWVSVCSMAAAGTILAFQSVQDPDSSLSYAAVDCVTVSTRLNGARILSCSCHEGVYVSTDDSSCEALYDGGFRTFFLSVFWMASLAWGGMVLRSIVSATVAGSVASWWFSPNYTAPVRGAFVRATSVSLGPVCKAAAISCSVGLFRSVLRRAGRVGQWLNQFALGWVQQAVDYVLVYTITFIGIYGFDFSEAGDHVSKLFQKRRVTVLANDIMVDVALTMLNVAVTLGYLYSLWLLMLLLLAISSVIPAAGVPLVFFLLVGVFGYVACGLVMSTTLEIVRSGYKAVFVCFVQDPEALATNRDPRLHRYLSMAWEEMHKSLSVTEISRKYGGVWGYP